MTTLYSLLVWYKYVIGFANFHKCLTKGAMNVKQIAKECSGPPLGSYVTQRVHRASHIIVHGNELTAAWPDPPTLI